MNEQSQQQYTQFTTFAKKQFKKVPKDVLPGLWALHENISDTFDEALARLILQFYLDTQVIIGEAAENAGKLVSSIKSEMKQLEEITKRFDKTSFAELPPPDVLRRKVGATTTPAPPPKPE